MGQESGPPGDVSQADAGHGEEGADLAQRLEGMALVEKVELARTAEKKVREILLESAPPELQLALLENPDISGLEVHSIASSKDTDREVIRTILQTKRFLQSNAIRLALVKNTNTPVKAALRLLSYIKDVDLEKLTQNPDISRPVALGANEILAQRQDTEAVPPRGTLRPSEGAYPTGAQQKEGAAQPISKLAESQPVTEQERANLFLQIQRMSMAEKIKLAMIGNKEVRGILIRDPSKATQVAVVNNPRITETEIERIASSKTVEDEVIRLILNNREWLKAYAVKLALVKNPKTPVKAALRLVPHLRSKDLKEVARSKGISNVVVVGAKKVLHQRSS